LSRLLPKFEPVSVAHTSQSITIEERSQATKSSSLPYDGELAGEFSDMVETEEEDKIESIGPMATATTSNETLFTRTSTKSEGFSPILEKILRQSVLFYEKDGSSLQSNTEDMPIFKKKNLTLRLSLDDSLVPDSITSFRAGILSTDRLLSDEGKHVQVLQSNASVNFI